MFQKIKTVFCIVGIVLSVVLLAVILFMLRGRYSDGLGSPEDNDRDRRIKEGITECKEQSSSVSGRIESAAGSLDRCYERLCGVENILREAVRKSRETK